MRERERENELELELKLEIKVNKIFKSMHKWDLFLMKGAQIGLELLTKVNQK